MKSVIAKELKDANVVKGPLVYGLVEDYMSSNIIIENFRRKTG